MNFEELLERHDFYYVFSEDERIYEKGLEEEKVIKDLCKSNPRFEELYREKFEKLFKINKKEP